MFGVHGCRTCCQLSEKGPIGPPVLSRDPFNALSSGVHLAHFSHMPACTLPIHFLFYLAFWQMSVQMDSPTWFHHLGYFRRPLNPQPCNFDLHLQKDKESISLSSLNTMSLTGLSQRVAYFYPTGVTLLHTSSPSPFRAWLRAVARAWICIEVTRAPVAGRGLVWHRARFHQPWRRAQPRQEEHTCAEPRLPGRGAAVVARQGRRTNSHWYISPIGWLAPLAVSFAIVYLDMSWKCISG